MRKEFSHGSFIDAGTISLSDNFHIGDNVHITVRGRFELGRYSRFGNDVTIIAEKVIIGDHFYHYEPGLNIGGGGSQFPDAILTIGDRCVVHNNKINLARPVTIGNDVGLSPDVDIITHGFWQSPLEGYPMKYGPVTIGNGVIIGQRSMILPGVSIADNVVIGAQSVVTKSITGPGIWAGSPAKYVGQIMPPSEDEKIKIMDDIMKRYRFLVDHSDTAWAQAIRVIYEYPTVSINDATINVEAKTIVGIEDTLSDQFRDHLRRHGIRVYSTRPFISL